jgi:Fuc2NAc and GlcNAc transferase
MTIGCISLAALLASYLLTAWLLRLPLARRLVDRPNPRSSHSVPTPRGGGLSIVAALTGGAIVMTALGLLPLRLSAVLLLGGLGIAAVGFWDDARSAPVSVRMLVHFLAAAFAVYLVGGDWVLHLGRIAFDLGVMGPIAAVLAIVWALNLFNFMDGIDGIAASEAACVLFGAGALELCVAGSTPRDVAPLFVAGAACLGFLRWNWPPAAIFMGDVGSGYLGYVIAVIALYSSRTGTLNIFAWLILGGTFVVDATLTLLRRLLRRETLHQAHRTHAYQWLARRWGSHARVTSAVVVIDLVWLLPCAAVAVKFPQAAPLICVLALTPLVVAAHFAGSGRPE